MIIVRKHLVLLSVLSVLHTQALPLYFKRDHQTNYGLVSQIGDGQIQAPAESTAAPEGLQPQSALGAIGLTGAPSQSAVIINTADTADSAESGTTLAGYSSSALATPVTSGSPVSLGGVVQTSSQARDAAGTSPATASPATTAAPLAGLSLDALASTSRQNGAAQKSTNSYALVTQINDGQIQAPYQSTDMATPSTQTPISTALLSSHQPAASTSTQAPAAETQTPSASTSSTLAATGSLVPLTTSQPYDDTTLAASLPLIPLTTSQPYDSIATSEDIGTTSNIGFSGSFPKVSAQNSSVATTQSSVATTQSSAVIPTPTLTPAITSSPTTSPTTASQSSVLAATKSTASYALVTQISDGQIQAPAESSVIQAQEKASAVSNEAVATDATDASATDADDDASATDEPADTTIDAVDTTDATSA